MSGSMSSAEKELSQEKELLAGLALDPDAEPTMTHPINVFVGGLAKTCDEAKLTQFMSQFGYVKEVYISKDGATGRHKCFAFVNFHSIDRIEELFGKHKFMGRLIEVKRSLQHYLVLMQVPVEAKESDIVRIFRTLGHRIVEVLIGGRVPGILPGTVAVRLHKFYDQLDVYRMGPLFVLGKQVKMMLHIRQPRFRKKLSAKQEDNLDELCPSTNKPVILSSLSDDMPTLPEYGNSGPFPSDRLEKRLPNSVRPCLFGIQSKFAIEGNSLPSPRAFVRKPSEFLVVSSNTMEQEYQTNLDPIWSEVETQIDTNSYQGTPIISEHRKYANMNLQSSSPLALPKKVASRIYADPPSFTPTSSAAILIRYYAFPGHL